MSEYRWVIGYDKKTHEIVKHVVCPKNNALAHQAMLEIEGLDAEIITDEEADRLIEERKRQDEIG